ncbi:hypothetical protein LguiB_032289 [Lonicera macranthoides]
MRTLVYANDATIDDDESIDKSNEHYGQTEFVQHVLKEQKRKISLNFINPYFSSLYFLIEWDGEVFIVVTKYIQWSTFNPINYNLRAHIYSHLIQVT